MWSATRINPWFPFIIDCISDLTSVCQNTLPLFFADDPNRFLEENDLKAIQNKSNEELENIAS